MQGAMQRFDGAPEAPAPPRDPGWQRLHLSSPILNGLTTATQFWPVLLVALLNRGGGATPWLIVAGGAVTFFGYEAVRYLRFDYRLEGAALVVRSGVLVRRTRTVPADRVQQVSRNQKLRHRIFGVAEILVEVAGSGTEPDIKLSVVTAAEAERIRVRLQDARREVGALPPEPDRVIYQQPNRSLIRWAAFASPLFMVPVAAAAFGALGDAVDLEAAWGWLPDGAQLWFLAALGIVGLAAATAVNVARFYDMRLVQADENLRLEYGLLTHRRLELPVPRIQALVTKLTPSGRLAKTIGITAHNASSAGEATNSHMPAVPRADRDLLIGQLMPGVASFPSVTAHPPAALRRALIRWSVPAAGLAGAAWLFFGDRGGALGLLIIAGGALLGRRAYRILGHASTEQVFVARRGAVTVHETVVLRSRVQSTSLGANWFQRRLGLATVRIDVAEPLGKVTIRDMAAAEARAMTDRLATLEPAKRSNSA